VINLYQTDSDTSQLVHLNSKVIYSYITVIVTSALTKNATKPNPFKIIPLQTTKKENNWKTEETLAGAVVIGDGTDQRVQSLI
jgi:hypothetical protein